MILGKSQLTVASDCLSHAGLLLFGQYPQRLVRTAYAQIGRFEDEAAILDERSAAGNLFVQLEQTMQALRAYTFVRYEIPTAATGRSSLEDLQRREVWEFPYDAVREAVLNALVHRDYTSVGRIQIRVYRDRLVLSNPGSLPEGLSVNDLFKEHRSFPRNPAIAQTIYYTRLIEKWGTGTVRMQNACRAAGAPDPEFEVRPNEFVVTLRKGSRLFSSSALPLFASEEGRILEWAKGRASFTVSECLEALDMTRRRARYLISRLVQKGMLTPQGENRQRRYRA